MVPDNNSSDPTAPAEQSVQGAVRVSDKHFHGKPCKKCGGTLRYVSGENRCVTCRRRWKREALAKNTPYAERCRAWARAKYHEKSADPAFRERERERDRTRKREKRANDPGFVELERKRTREYYRNLDHIAYYERQLKKRRYKALKRKEARHRGSLSDEG